MDSLSRSQRVLLKPITTIAAAGLLLLIGVIAMLYQFQSVHTERRRQLTSQARTLAASVTAAIAFNDHAAAQEYVKALMLDPRVDAVAVYNEAGRLVAGAHMPGSAPIPTPRTAPGKRPQLAKGLLLVDSLQKTADRGRLLFFLLEGEDRGVLTDEVQVLLYEVH